MPNPSDPITILPQYEAQVNSIRLRSFGQGHRYIVPGYDNTMQSVTTELGKVVAKPYLIPWAQREERKKVLPILRDFLKDGHVLTYEQLRKMDIENLMAARKNAGERASDAGTEAHGRIEDWILSDEAPYNEETHFVSGFLNAEHLRPKRVEMKVYHPTEEFAGTIDLVARNADGGLVIADWKRSKDIYSEYAYQVAGYALALEELTGENVTACYVVRLPRTDENGEDPRPGEWRKLSGLKLRDREMAYLDAHEWNRRLNVKDAEIWDQT